jgi:hypothetical protein
MIIFESKLVDGQWKYPENITFKNWKVNGVLRLMGMGPSSDTTIVKDSSESLGHTKRMRVAAPRRITNSNVHLDSDERIPVIFAPGVHEWIFENSLNTGKSRSTGLYIDAGSGDNMIHNNIFDVAASREVIALDGSARNKVTGNIFWNIGLGGVHVYRNSGERGVVRHQEPRANHVSNNYFRVTGRAARAVFLGSRNEASVGYSGDDFGFPFGSSMNNNDFARDSIVDANIIAGQNLTLADPSVVNGSYIPFEDTEGDDGNNKITNTKINESESISIAETVKKFKQSLQMPDLTTLMK